MAAGVPLHAMSRNQSDISTIEPRSASTTGVYSFYLAGQWLTSSKVVDVTSPFDQRVVGRVSLAGPEHVEEAIAAAEKAFAVTRKLAAYERQKALAKIAAELSGRAEEFAQCISAEAGKPIRTARGEVERAAFCFQYAAEETTRLNGELLPLDAQAVSANRLGLLRAGSAGAGGGDYAVQFSAEPGGAQDRAGAGGGLLDRAEAGDQDSNGGADAGGCDGALGLSEGGGQHSADERRNGGAADRGRALQALHLHGIGRRRLGAEGACRKEAGCAGTGRKRRMHRSL